MSGLHFRSDGGFVSSEEEGEAMTFGVHSDEYAAVPHIEFFELLVKAPAEASLTNIGGEFRVYTARRPTAIVFLDAERQLDREDLGVLFTGLQVGNSYDGSYSMYAMDSYCRNTMRVLTDRRYRKHVVGNSCLRE